MTAGNFINENVDFKEKDRDKLPLALTKLECAILMEAYHQSKLKELSQSKGYDHK